MWLLIIDSGLVVGKQLARTGALCRIRAKWDLRRRHSLLLFQFYCGVIMEISELPNLTGWLIAMPILVTFLIYASYNRGDNWRVSKLLCGIGLISIGAHMASLYIELIAYSDSILLKKPDDEIWQAIIANSTLWLAVFPAVSIGLGVNLLSNWIATPVPGDV